MYCLILLLVVVSAMDIKDYYHDLHPDPPLPAQFSPVIGMQGYTSVSDTPECRGGNCQCSYSIEVTRTSLLPGVVIPVTLDCGPTLANKTAVLLVHKFFANYDSEYMWTTSPWDLRSYEYATCYSPPTKRDLCPKQKFSDFLASAVPYDQFVKAHFTSSWYSGCCTSNSGYLHKCYYMVPQLRIRAHFFRMKFKAFDYELYLKIDGEVTSFKSSKNLLHNKDFTFTILNPGAVDDNFGIVVVESEAEGVIDIRRVTDLLDPAWGYFGDLRFLGWRKDLRGIRGDAYRPSSKVVDTAFTQFYWSTCAVGSGSFHFRTQVTRSSSFAEAVSSFDTQNYVPFDMIQGGVPSYTFEVVDDPAGGGHMLPYFKYFFAPVDVGTVGDIAFHIQTKHLVSATLVDQIESVTVTKCKVGLNSYTKSCTLTVVVTPAFPAATMQLSVQSVDPQLYTSTTLFNADFTKVRKVVVPLSINYKGRTDTVSFRILLGGTDGILLTTTENKVEFVAKKGFSKVDDIVVGGVAPADVAPSTIDDSVIYLYIAVAVVVVLVTTVVIAACALYRRRKRLIKLNADHVAYKQSQSKVPATKAGNSSVAASDVVVTVDPPPTLSSRTPKIFNGI